MSNKKKVIVLAPVLAHYRDDIYKSLLKSNNYEFEMIGGDNYLGIKSLIGDSYKTFKYTTFKVLKHKFFLLKGSIKYIISQKPDIIIMAGIDFHLLHTLVIFFIHRLLLRKRFYWWSHGSSGNQGEIGLILRKYIYRYSSGVLLYSEQGKHNLLKIGLKEKKLKVVNNCLNYEDYGYLNYNLSEEKKHEIFTILYVGRITKEKNIELLIEALSIVNRRKDFEFKCYIVGGGNIKSGIELAKKKDVYDKINFTGPKYGVEVHKYFIKSDLFVYPSGIGLSILHALSFGLPVITVNDISLHFPEFELLQLNKNGDLFKKDSSSDLVAKIKEWKKKLASDKKDIVKDCIDSIQIKGYLPNQVSEKILDFLNE